MAYSNYIKGLPLQRVIFLVSRKYNPDGEFTDANGSYDKVPHFIVSTKSGAVIDIQPTEGVGRDFYISGGTVNAYPNIFYGWKGNKILATDGDANRSSKLMLYDPITGKKTPLNLGRKTGLYDEMNKTSTAPAIYGANVSTDGYIFGASFRHRGAPATWLLNTETDTFEWINYDCLPKYAQIFNTNTSDCLKIIPAGGDPAGEFDGLYHNCIWDDDGNKLFEICRAEAAANNIVFKGNASFMIHDLDRAIASVKRRMIIAASINGGSVFWYVIDLNSPSTYYRISGLAHINADNGARAIYLSYLTCVNELGATVDRTNWTNTRAVSGQYGLVDGTYTGETTLNLPSYNPSLFYATGTQVGRFGYIDGYTANKVHPYYMPISLRDEMGYKKGDMIIPSNWSSIDYGAEWYSNGLVGIYVCNFDGNYGFGSDDEYVSFFTNPDNGDYGFLSPADLTFVAYNPDLFASQQVNGGYVIREVLVMNEGEFGCYYTGYEPVVTEVIQGEEYYVDSIFGQSNSAIKKDFTLLIDQSQEVCDFSVEVLPDKTKPHQRWSYGVKNIPTTNGDFLNATEMSENELLFAGITYSGLILFDRHSGTGVLTSVGYWDRLISFKGSLKISDTEILYYGYSAVADYIDISDRGNLSQGQTKIAVNGVIPEVTYASLYSSNIVLIVGNYIRSATYIGGYGGFGYINLTTKTSHRLPNTPFEISQFSSIRISAGLSASAYSDAEVESAFASYISAQGISRMEGIARFENTSRYTSQGFETYKDGSGKLVLELYWGGISALRGIRINEQADGLGTWHEDNLVMGTKVGTANVNKYARICYVHKADQDLSTLQSSDYKYVEFTDLQNIESVGRIAISDDYVAFLSVNNAASKCTVRVISKTNLETAANGTGQMTIGTTIDIPLGSSAIAFGFGSQGGGYLFNSKNGTPRNSFFCVGNYLFATITTETSSPYVAVVRIDLATGTVVTWCTDTGAKSVAKGITYNPSTDTAYFTRDTTAFRIPNFTTLTPPYALI